jgi:hypothetical protein
MNRFGLGSYVAVQVVVLVALLGLAWGFYSGGDHALAAAVVGAAVTHWFREAADVLKALRSKPAKQPQGGERRFALVPYVAAQVVVVVAMLGFAWAVRSVGDERLAAVVVGAAVTQRFRESGETLRRVGSRNS